MSVNITAIVCTRNRKDHLVRTLESLRNPLISGGLTYEILLIDNGSTDGTYELIDDFVRRDPEIWKYYSEPKKGLSNARNCGVKQARGEVIAFTDDDAIIDKNWLQALWRTFADKPDVIALQGRILLQEEIKRLPPWADPDEMLFCTHYDPGTVPCYTETLIGANMAFRKKAFEKYGLFDTRLGAGASGFCEETEFCMRLKEAGEKIYYQPEALVFHEYDEERFTWEYWCKRMQQVAHSHAIIDVLLKQKRVSRFENRTKHARYLAKYFLYTLMGNQRKRYKYDRRIRFLNGYMKSVAELRKS